MLYHRSLIHIIMCLNQ